jgi:membrane-bound ClpP family serine protease
MHDRAISIFGFSGTLRAVPDVDVVEMSLILDSGHALPSVFKCRRGDNLIVTESAPLDEFLVSVYRLPAALRVLRSISDGIVAIINWFVRVLNGITGSFFGVGGLGIFIAVMLVLLMLAMSLYAFLITLPFLIILFFVRFVQNAAIKKEAAMLQQQVADFYFSTFVAQPPSTDSANV